ncbi:hypothetical protein BH11PSE11_BH11PSE11_09540 [soil metagenome]
MRIHSALKTGMLIAALSSSIAQAATVNVVEFYHPTLNHYFRTADLLEASGIDAGAAGAGWVRTGDNFTAWSDAASAPSGAASVCRFYGTPGVGPNSHFYTASASECTQVKTDPGWLYENIAFHALPPQSCGCATGTTPVYRTYNNRFASNDSNHRFTTNASTYLQMTNLGWAAETTVMCVAGASTASSNPVVVTKLNAQTVGSNAITSSSKLKVDWSSPSFAVDHFLITATEAIMNTSVSTTALSSASSATLTGLKAATTYSITVTACKDSACTQTGKFPPVCSTTTEEYWQLQGTGSNVAGLTRIVSDGNAKISATRFGPEAGGATASRIQLYYGPSNSQVSKLATAVTAQDTSASNPASYLSFTSMATTTGLFAPPTGTINTLATNIATGQGVPLSAAMGAKVRLFFEAQGSDGKTRVLYLDSQDGYTGRDFNSGSAATCSTAADYQTGGGCVPQVAIGVEGDAAGVNTKIANARQFKLGYPVLNDWRWDGAVGTYMVFTSGAITGCSNADRTHGYAVWDGSKWNVQYQANGCPKLFEYMQAGFPMHLGGARYKMYFGHTSDMTGKLSGNLPYLGPKKLIYADGATSGAAGTVDFEDWETTAVARNVIFLWPSGEQLNTTAEGYIDDFHFMSPTANLDLQVMYLAITDGVIAPIAAGAILLNP